MSLSDAQPTPEQAHLDRACAAHDALTEAFEAMRSHVGAKSGPEWERKLQAYRDAWDAFDAVFKVVKAIKGGDE